VKIHSKPENRTPDLSQLYPAESWQPETLAGRFLISRFPIPPAQADLIARLAGLGGKL
jgi:hypothetical protein